MKFNKNHITTLLSFLENYSDCYFIIGGQAASLHFNQVGLEFRSTKDFDIVLITKLDNSNFSKQITKMILEGGYKNKYKNNKKNAYRFENPISNEFPAIIEFFVEEGKYIESIDKRFAKLDIEINEDKISALVLSGELYRYAFKHKVVVDGLSTIDTCALIALKIYAYFNNLVLYQKHLVDKDEYLKHRRDIFRLLTITNGEEQSGELPKTLKESIINYLPILQDSKDLVKQYKIDGEKLISIYIKMFKL